MQRGGELSDWWVQCYLAGIAGLIPTASNKAEGNTQCTVTPVNFHTGRSLGAPKTLKGDLEMAIIIKGKACPKCQDTYRSRLRRSFWMRIIPATKYYECEHCHSKFVAVRESLSVNWPFGKTAWVIGARLTAQGSRITSVSRTSSEPEWVELACWRLPHTHFQYSWNYLLQGIRFQVQLWLGSKPRLRMLLRYRNI